jgi:hypothetical protein
MSKIIEVSPVPLPETKPTDRGLFSPDRAYWERLHQARYTRWQLGTSVDDIAAEENASSNTIRHSLAWCESRLPKADVVAGRAMRLRLLAFSKLTERYVAEVEHLLDDANPFVRLKAMEAFRKTVGLEAGAGVNVNVNQQTAVVTNGDSARGSKTF